MIIFLAYLSDNGLKTGRVNINFFVLEMFENVVEDHLDALLVHVVGAVGDAADGVASHLFVDVSQLFVEDFDYSQFIVH